MVASTAFSFSMNCQHCGTRNGADEDRCTRCGRRLHPANPRPAPDGYRPVLITTAQSAHAAAVAPAAPTRVPRQPVLFHTTESLKVIPIAEPAQRPAAPKPKAAARRLIRHDDDQAQQQLAFGPIVSVTRQAPVEIESQIFTEARVATMQHRALAAFVDGGIILAAYAVLAAIYVVWGGGQVGGDPLTLAVAGALALMVVVLYQALWVLGNGDSVGLQIARLKLVNFDGRNPKRRERLYRMASAWLSIAPAGLGLVWALLDEEALTWHDQISKTFPSPLDGIKSA